MASTAISLAPLLLGLALGLRHALDPDHIAAMGTIVTREPSPGRAAALGGVWGLGHSISLFAASIVIIALDIPIPARAAALLELLVAAMLIVLGVQMLLRTFRPSPTLRVVTARRPFLVGLVHGLAGSGGLALLVLPGLRDPLSAMAFVGLFAVGSAGGMALWSAALAWPLGKIPRRHPKAGIWIGSVSGLASVLCGIVVVMQIA
jgi:nickel/cobalt exporter